MKLLLDHFDTLSDQPRQLDRLRNFVLQLAVRGKLTEQNPNDEPATALLDRIRAERDRLVKEKKIRKPKKLPPVDAAEVPFVLPEGWVWVRLGEVIHFQNGFAFKSSSFSDKGVPVVRIGDIQKGKVSLQRIKRVPQEIFDQVGFQYHIEKGDILLAMSGATTGKIGVSDLDEKVLLNQRVGKVIPFLINSKYITSFLQKTTESFLKRAWGSAQPNFFQPKF